MNPLGRRFAWEAIRLVALAAFYQQPEVMHLLDHVEGTAHPPAPAGPPEWLLRPLLDPPEQGVESPAAKPASSNPES